MNRGFYSIDRHGKARAVAGADAVSRFPGDREAPDLNATNKVDKFHICLAVCSSIWVPFSRKFRMSPFPQCRVELRAANYGRMSLPGN